MSRTYNTAAARPFSAVDLGATMGRARSRITCPFCHEAFIAFRWSIAGTGKRCPRCGAMHGSTGTAAPEIKS